MLRMRRSNSKMAAKQMLLNVISSLLLSLAVFSWNLLQVSSAYEVVYAVNCGGPTHRDRNGIKYKSDTNKVGIASDFGKSMIISRASQEDQILYQTERYHTSHFTYDVPITSDGQYTLVLKFAEVYFQWANGKVFDVMLNRQHTILENLDIFAKVGRAIAHEEVIPFKVEDGQLIVNDESSNFDGTLVVEFVKGAHDNPKINAILVIKGSPEELPPLPPVQQDPDELPSDRQEQTEWGESKARSSHGHSSGPRISDPYASDDSWFMPITIAIAVFLPVLFCLCRLR